MSGMVVVRLGEFIDGWFEGVSDWVFRLFLASKISVGERSLGSWFLLLSLFFASGIIAISMLPIDGLLLRLSFASAAASLDCALLLADVAVAARLGFFKLVWCMVDEIGVTPYFSWVGVGMLLVVRVPLDWLNRVES